MTKDQFYGLLREALERAAQNAESSLKRPVPRKFRIELHGLGHSSILLTPEEIRDATYLGSDRFFKIIDVAVTEIGADQTTVFLRVSGHTPCGFSETWDPKDLGPFKQILSTNIRVASDD